jgi:hypothetical protein
MNHWPLSWNAWCNCVRNFLPLRGQYRCWWGNADCSASISFVFISSYLSCDLLPVRKNTCCFWSLWRLEPCKHLLTHLIRETVSTNCVTLLWNCFSTEVPLILVRMLLRVAIMVEWKSAASNALACLGIFIIKITIKLLLSQHNNYQELNHTSPCNNEFTGLMALCFGS